MRQKLSPAGGTTPHFLLLVHCSRFSAPPVYWRRQSINGGEHTQHWRRPTTQRQQHRLPPYENGGKFGQSNRSNKASEDTKITAKIFLAHISHSHLRPALPVHHRLPGPRFYETHTSEMSFTHSGLSSFLAAIKQRER